MGDSTAMTIEFLRARLLSERSVSKSARQRADHLAKRVMELEEQVRIATFQRKRAEEAANEVLTILESRGFNDFSEIIDSSSDLENFLEEGKACDDNSGENVKDDRASTTLIMDGGSEAGISPSQGGNLSWKSRANSSDSSDKKKGEQPRRTLKQNLISRVGSSPQLHPGKSCRKLKIPAGGSEAPQTDLTSDCADDGVPMSKEVADAAPERVDGEGNHLGGDEGANGFTADQAMERAIEQQDRLIVRYMAEENAQREWEQNHKDPSDQEEKGIESAQYIEGMKTTSEHRDEPVRPADDPAVPPASSGGETPADDPPPSDHVGEMTEAADSEIGRFPKEIGGDDSTRSPQLSGVVDDRRLERPSSSSAGSEGGGASREEWWPVQNPIDSRGGHADPPPEKYGGRAGNVLGALQRAKRTLWQELNRFEPPRGESSSAGIPFGPRTLFRLPSDINIKAESPACSSSPPLSFRSHGGFGDGITISTCTETRTSVSATLSRNLGATIAGGYSSSFAMTGTSSLYGGLPSFSFPGGGGGGGGGGGSSSGVARLGRRFNRLAQ